jgi:hypothetical protein
MISAGWSGLIANREIVLDPACSKQNAQFTFLIHVYHRKITNVDYGENFAICRGFDSPLREQRVGAIRASDTMSTFTASGDGKCESLTFRQKHECGIIFYLN